TTRWSNWRPASSAIGTSEVILLRALSSDPPHSYHGLQSTRASVCAGRRLGIQCVGRATTDIDILLLLEQPSRDRLQSLLSSLFDSTIVHSAAMVFHGISIWRCVGILKNQEVVIDLLLADSEYLQTALSRRRQILLDDLSVPILTVEDLILLKTLAGRLQDQVDLEKIRLRQDELHVD
ncbi:MAG: hypothetical protein LV473_20210, partial [Nitrospira sp.]|nr:hypothetical protein [Nitrospira sp.]